MKKILLDGKEIDVVVPESLPMLIHGEEGSGASLYTITLAAKWFTQDYNVLFLCSYSMAEEEFVEQVGARSDKVKFYTKDQIEDFKRAFYTVESEKTIIVVKNIELFDESIFDLISNVKNLIISRDINKATSKDKLLKRQFVTEVLFSHLENRELPQLNKYQAFVVSGDYQGITQIV